MRLIVLKNKVPINYEKLKDKGKVHRLWNWAEEIGTHVEKVTATHSSILAWRIPWREEPGVLLSMGQQVVGCDYVTVNNSTHCHAASRKLQGFG